MPTTRASAAAADHKPEARDLEKPAESEEQVDLDGDNEPEDAMEEEVEYEEVEEEEEVEVEEEVEEEEEEEEEDSDAANEVGAQDGNETDNFDEDEKRKHAELLALPPHGSEVYLGGIPQDASEDDLRGFCETIGEVTEIRIMKGKESTDNKGYAFVTFRTKDLARKAIDDLHNTELKGRRIKCSTSQAKHKLFIGNLPREWGEEDVKKTVTAVGPGVVAVELLKDQQNSSRNRGFVFVEYYNHACAEYSRQKMSKPEFKLDSNAPTVSWADPKNADSTGSQVRAVYVKNLPNDITQDRLKRLFDHHGKIMKVVLPPAKAGQEKSRYGFVHFAERSSALRALKNTEKYEIDGQELECSLAKPQSDQKSSGGQNSQSALLPTYPPRAGYGLLGGGAYGAASFAQPLMYGRGNSAAAGMAMLPMLLPDGRIGYVLQQPGTQPHSPPQQKNRSGGKRGSEGDRGRNRYNPY